MDIDARDAATGLCVSCAHARLVRSARGSTFLRCGLNGVRAGFAKYPRLPVVRCAGYERREAPPRAGDGDP